MTYDIIHEGQLNPRLNVCVFVKKKEIYRNSNHCGLTLLNDSDLLLRAVYFPLGKMSYESTFVPNREILGFGLYFISYYMIYICIVNHNQKNS